MTGLIFIIAVCMGVATGLLIAQWITLNEIRDILQDILTEVKWK